MIEQGDELSLTYDTARRTLTCRNLTRGGDRAGAVATTPRTNPNPNPNPHPTPNPNPNPSPTPDQVATIPRKGVPSNVPLAFALGGG